MENIKIACGNDIETFEKIENILDENYSMVWDLMNELSIDEIECEGFNRSLYEYYDRNYNEMYVEDLEEALLLLEELEEDNETFHRVYAECM